MARPFAGTLPHLVIGTRFAQVEEIAEAPPVAYFSQQFFLFVSDGILFVNSDKKYEKNAV